MHLMATRRSNFSAPVILARKTSAMPPAAQAVEKNVLAEASRKLAEHHRRRITLRPPWSPSILFGDRFAFGRASSRRLPLGADRGRARGRPAAPWGGLVAAAAAIDMSMQPLSGRHIVLGVCGSIAAYKAVLLLRQLSAAGATVWPVLTHAACRFVGADTFSALAGRPALVAGAGAGQAEGSEIAHVELAHRADAVVVAPATAHLMAQAAAGLCPDVLTSILLATRAPVVMAPAMEEGMWQHPATLQAAALLVQRGVHMVAPQAGALASGRSGLGRMAEPAAVLAELGRALTPPTLEGKRLVVTAGPTREALDPARFLSNPATGRMGLAVAQAARRRGAEVLLVLGPSDLPVPPDLAVKRVTSCAQMLAACQAQMQAGCDAFVMAAAPRRLAGRPPGQAQAAQARSRARGGANGGYLDHSSPPLPSPHHGGLCRRNA